MSTRYSRAKLDARFIIQHLRQMHRKLTTPLGFVMDKLTNAMMKFHQAIDACEAALLELENELRAENDRLRLALDTDEQDSKTDEGCATEKPVRHGLRLVGDARERNALFEAEHRRAKARDGIPYELRDIL